MLVAGFRALLLQACHPLVMAGFLANSDYRDDPWGRLQRTGDYVATLTYGTRSEADAVAARVRAIHARLAPITDEATGRTYRVDDPDLLLWVHCTEIESFLTTFRRCGGGLSDEEADRYVDEQREAARLIGLDPAEVPGSVADIERYYRDVRPQLRVTTQARLAAIWGFVPPMPAWVSLATPARPLWAGIVGLSAAMLPPWARRLYGLPGLPPTDIAASVTARALRTALLAVPESVRESPPQRAARARLGGLAASG